MTNFDAAALSYDASFTHSKIGKAQRTAVYQLVKPFLKNNKRSTVLEINCGTGEDAIWLSQFSDKIVATDQSKKMVAIAKSKGIHHENIHYQVLDSNDIEQINEPIDLIFSNFGGLNCLNPNELEKFIVNASKTLVLNGLLVMVIMPKNTLWERFYFFLKLEWSKMFRRKKAFATVLVEGTAIKTYYYNTNEIIKWGQNNFNFITKSPIGFFVPPSYIEPFAKKHNQLFNCLTKADKFVENWSFLSNYSDHYLLILEKK